VRSVDLQVALRRGDTALAASLTSEILETLGGVVFSDPVAASYTELKSRLSTDPVARSIERASGAEGALSKILGSPSFAFGRWVAAADLAAQAHYRTFFESSHGTRFIESMVVASRHGDHVVVIDKSTGRVINDSVAREDSVALRWIYTRTTQGLDDHALDSVHTILQTVIKRRGS
jgi:hypothetical protein